jgi:hypothetical protein
MLFPGTIKRWEPPGRAGSLRLVVNSYRRLRRNVALCGVPPQQRLFAGACRFVWNKVVALIEGRYQAGVPRLTYGDAAGALPLWKQSEEYGFLADVHSQVLQQCLKNLDRAYTNLFVGRAGPPAARRFWMIPSVFPRALRSMATASTCRRSAGYLSGRAAR